jgi:hypothetical protein
MSRTAFRSVLLSLLVGLTSANVIHVPSEQPTIQDGLNAASEDDSVLVSPGTYHENIVWPSTQGIQLMSEFGPDSTTIDGDSAGSVIRFEGIYDTTTLFYGFTLQNGAGTDLDSLSYGGGILCFDQAAPHIHYNFIEANSADHGGGIACIDASPRIVFNSIENNNADWGDGIYLDTDTSPTVRYNNVQGNGFGLLNADTSLTVDADTNWWGHESGPYHPDLNPAGQGDTVSDFVDFDPWYDIPILCGDVNQSGLVAFADGFEFFGYFDGVGSAPDECWFTNTKGYDHQTRGDGYQILNFCANMATLQCYQCSKVRLEDSQGDSAWLSLNSSGYPVLETLRIPPSGETIVLHMMMKNLGDTTHAVLYPLYYDPEVLDYHYTGMEYDSTTFPGSDLGIWMLLRRDTIFSDSGKLILMPWTTTYDYGIPLGTHHLSTMEFTVVEPDSSSIDTCHYVPESHLYYTNGRHAVDYGLEWTPITVLPGLCGDTNGDNVITPSDGFLVLNFFGGGTNPMSCWAGNVNGDDALTTADGYHLLNFFGAGPALDCQSCEF